MFSGLTVATGSAELLALVDDVRRDQDQKVVLVFFGARLAEQLADEREIDEERNANLRLRHRGDREPADDGGLAVADEELVVGALFEEGVAKVGRGRLELRALGVQRHENLAVVRDVRRDSEDDTGLLERHRGAWGGCRRSALAERSD